MAESDLKTVRHEPPAAENSASTTRNVAVALQGGGSHGAFTSGVLDGLLEEPTLNITGATGTSAGAMNATVLADALVRGGREEARRALRRFWASIGKMHSAADGTANKSVVNSTVSQNLSPYDLNPSNFNPLRGLLTEMIDFERLRSQNAVHIAVCATNVWSAVRRVFTNKDISVDAVLASACLPHMSPAVEIDGEPYWDGGWTGNPAITAILRDIDVHDLIIVRIDPSVRQETPRTLTEINDRIVEIGFNSTYWLEMGAIAVVLLFRDAGIPTIPTFFHCIEAPSELVKLASSSKMNTDPAFLEDLFHMGRQTADAWLAENSAAVGQRSTFDLKALLPAGFKLEHSLAPDTSKT
jgi:NTE family protein